jgi:hypothetical protein
MEEAIKLFGKFDSIDKIINDFKSKGPDYQELVKILEPKDFSTMLYLLYLPKKNFNKFSKELNIKIDPLLIDFFKSLKIKIKYTVEPIKPIGLKGLSKYLGFDEKLLKEIYKYSLTEIKKTKLLKERKGPAFKTFNNLKKYIEEKFEIYQDILGVYQKVKIRKFKKEIFPSTFRVNKENDVIISKYLDLNTFYPQDAPSVLIHELTHLQQFKGDNLFLPPTVIYEGFAHYFEEFAHDIIPDMEPSYSREKMLRLVRYKALYEFHTGKIDKLDIYRQFMAFTTPDEAKIEFEGCLISPYKMNYLIGKYLFKKYTKGDKKLVMKLFNEGVWTQWNFLRKNCTF